ncbi:MAG: hypothetical protein LBS79_08920 [Tannerella sp.]|nr:hypothetical protein [Tannerella sp.]
MNKKHQKRPFRKERKEAGYFGECDEELDDGKCKVTVKILKRAIRTSLLASYILMDSRFVTDTMLYSVRAIRGGLLHIVGMCKMDRRKFKVGNHEYNSESIRRIISSKEADRNVIILLNAINQLNIKYKKSPCVI